MTVIRGGVCGPDGVGGAYLNEAETDRTLAWWALGGQQGVRTGGAIAAVAGQMAVDVAAIVAMVSERDATANLQNRGYLLWSDQTTRVTFGPASVAARNDALVAAFVDTEDGPVGTGGLDVGAHLVVVPGVSGTTTPRTDSDITTFLGRGGWIRLANVPIASTDTQINVANMVDTTVPMIGQWRSFTPKVYANAAPTTPVSSTPVSGQCRYMYLTPDTVVAHAEVTIPSAITAPLIDLPVTALTRQFGIGECGLWGSGTPADQSGTAFMASGNDKLVCAVAFSNGFRDSSAGNICRYSVIYKIT